MNDRRYRRRRDVSVGGGQSGITVSVFRTESMHVSQMPLSLAPGNLVIAALFALEGKWQRGVAFADA